MKRYKSAKYIGKYGLCQYCSCHKVMYFVCNNSRRMVHTSRCMSCKRMLRTFKGIYPKVGATQRVARFSRGLPRDFDLLRKKFPQLRGRLKNR
jgi:hypothetical protein